MRIWLRLWFYNNVKRHWHNWRWRRIWLADPNRPEICPVAGKISRETYDWANRALKDKS